MEKKYLKLYKQWMTSGEMTSGGLCDIFGVYDELFNLVKPDEYDKQQLELEDLPRWLWGYGLPKTGYLNDQFYTFTPLRQNIVLLMAAMNGEL